LNVFAQTLPTSIAEVVICWAIVGTAFESFIQPKERRRKRTRIALIIIIGTTVSHYTFWSISFCA
jgi:predicted benzoate:H+ symporter BenE